MAKRNDDKERPNAHEEQSGPQRPLIKAGRHFEHFKKRENLIQENLFLKLTDRIYGFLVSEENIEGQLVDEISFLSQQNLTLRMTRFEAFILTRALELHFRAKQPVFARRDGQTFIPVWPESEETK